MGRALDLQVCYRVQFSSVLGLNQVSGSKTLILYLTLPNKIFLKQNFDGNPNKFKIHKFYT